MSEYCLLISSCDAFSDLWQAHFDLLKKNAVGDLPPVYLITDKPTQATFDGVTILYFEGDMPIRIKKALEAVPQEKVLLTLDDYFVIKPTVYKDIEFLVDYAQKNNVDYLSLYNRRKTNKKYYKPLGTFEKIDLTGRYAVTLYPAIWDKKFLFYCIDEDATPWSFEPTLTKKATLFRANCLFSPSQVFDILDVVRKGKVLSKANDYFKKNGIDIGDRPLIKKSTEAYLAVADFISWHSPKWLLKLIKSIAKLFGAKFYSED